MEIGKVPIPNGGLVPPIFFIQKILKLDGVGTELVRSIHRGGIFRGQMVGKGAYSTEFHMELRRSDRAYIVRTKGVSYALN